MAKRRNWRPSGEIQDSGSLVLSFFAFRGDKGKQVVEKKGSEFGGSNFKEPCSVSLKSS